MASRRLIVNPGERDFGNALASAALENGHDRRRFRRCHFQRSHVLQPIAAESLLLGTDERTGAVERLLAVHQFRDVVDFHADAASNYLFDHAAQC